MEIVDLPLVARVAATGSVTTRRLFALERYPTVWQLTSEVTARPRAGTTLLDEFDWGNRTTRLEITAEGPWTITVKSTRTLPAYGAGRAVSGRGDSVFRYTGGNSSRYLTHSGGSNFAIWSYADNGMDDLLVNRIGRYSGRVTYPGPGLVEVTADGAALRVEAIADGDVEERRGRVDAGAEETALVGAVERADVLHAPGAPCKPGPRAS